MRGFNTPFMILSNNPILTPSPKTHHLSDLTNRHYIELCLVPYIGSAVRLVNSSSPVILVESNWVSHPSRRRQPKVPHIVFPLP
jgi:hypothetical protein